MGALFVVFRVLVRLFLAELLEARIAAELVEIGIEPKQSWR
jgi:hypothetical protein